MADFTFIVLARAVHVMAGVSWAGSTFLLALAIVPLAGQQGAGPWLGQVTRRVGRYSMISALLTVFSGIYLYHALHAQDHSAGALVLKAGAAAALLSLAVGLLVGRPAGQRLAQLQQARMEGGAPVPEAAPQLAALSRRVALSARIAAGLLGLSVLAMAVFRYATSLT